MEPTDSVAGSSQVNSTYASLLAFDDENVKHWFTVFEIGTRNASDWVKFSNACKALPLRVTAAISDLLLNPPKEDRYQAVKSAVIGLFSISDTERYKKLFMGLTLGSRKPSVLLREMR